MYLFQSISRFQEGKLYYYSIDINYYLKDFKITNNSRRGWRVFKIKWYRFQNGYEIEGVASKKGIYLTLRVWDVTGTVTPKRKRAVSRPAASRGKTLPVSGYRELAETRTWSLLAGIKKGRGVVILARVETWLRLESWSLQSTIEYSTKTI